jgi:NADH-quinone oxidoreductase subunit I
MDTFTDDRKGTPSRYADSIKISGNRRIMEQPVDQEGLLTIQYPEEKRILPERFRYIPMLIWDTQKGEDLCTACGICAKVCPPQCIWIVRDSDENGRPVARPAEFFIDAAVCMSCSFCTEFCPFDAIKMNHDFELAVFDRYPQLVYDKAELTVPVEYYAALWPTQYAAEEEARRKEEAEKAAKAAAKAKADAAKASATTEKPKRSAEELQALKEKAAARTAAAKANTAGGAASSGGSEDADARKARLEELKRKAAEKAKARKESGE